MKKKKKNKPKVIIPATLKIKPHELWAAELLAEYFDEDIECLEPENTYEKKTPDFKIAEKKYELKTPEGKGKNVVKKQISRAKKQSENIVISAARYPYTDTVIRNRILHALKKITKGNKIKSLFFIAKTCKIEKLL